MNFKAAAWATGVVALVISVMYTIYRWPEVWEYIKITATVAGLWAIIYLFANGDVTGDNEENHNDP